MNAERARHPHIPLDDLYAEWDAPETIEAVRAGLASHPDVTAEVIEAVPDRAIDRLLVHDLDIVFNLAEGFAGAAREAQFPALLEMLQIPYTGSGPLALAIMLDKARTKEILSYHGIPVARFITSDRPIGSIRSMLPGSDFPFIVKPISEGSSKGIRNSSFVTSLDAMNRRSNGSLKTYHQPALIEEFLPGREFTVAVLGNGETCADACRSWKSILANFRPKQIIFIRLKQNGFMMWRSGRFIFSPALRMFRRSSKKRSRRSCCERTKILECRDWARIDVRLDARGRVNVIEVNPLPGILPKPEENSCFPKAARAAGLTYETMLLSVLKSGCDRYGIPFHFERKQISLKMQAPSSE